MSYQYLITGETPVGGCQQTSEGHQNFTRTECLLQDL